jgi:hypothetical protein
MFLIPRVRRGTLEQYKSPKIKYNLKGYTYGEIRPMSHRFFFFQQCGDMVLSYMEEEGISKADLAKRLGKTRSAVTQMFNKTPNITIKKMVEIADAIGIDIEPNSPQIHLSKHEDFIII